MSVSSCVEVKRWCCGREHGDDSLHRACLSLSRSFSLGWFPSTCSAVSILESPFPTFLHFSLVLNILFSISHVFCFDLFPCLVSRDDETITHCPEYLTGHSLPEQSRLLIFHAPVFGQCGVEGLEDL